MEEEEDLNGIMAEMGGFGEVVEVEVLELHILLVEAEMVVLMVVEVVEEMEVMEENMEVEVELVLDMEILEGVEHMGAMEEIVYGEVMIKTIILEVKMVPILVLGPIFQHLQRDGELEEKEIIIAEDILEHLAEVVVDLVVMEVMVVKEVKMGMVLVEEVVDMEVMEVTVL